MTLLIRQVKSTQWNGVPRSERPITASERLKGGDGYQEGFLRASVLLIIRSGRRCNPSTAPEVRDTHKERAAVDEYMFATIGRHITITRSCFDQQFDGSGLVVSLERAVTPPSHTRGERLQ
jgi:hypothetical protein